MAEIAPNEAGSAYCEKHCHGIITGCHNGAMTRIKPGYVACQKHSSCTSKHISDGRSVIYGSHGRVNTNS